MRRIFSVLLFIAMASALTMVVETTDGTVALSSSSMLVKINSDQNWMEINGVLKVPMFPTVISKGSIVKPSIPQESKLTPNQKITSYTLSYPENFAGDVFASVNIEVREDYISQIINLENTGDAELNIDLEILPLNTGTYYVFAPYKRDNTANYLLISPAYANEKAEGVIIAFDTIRPTFDQPQEINSKNSFVRTLAWNIPLAAGEKKSISLKYEPGYVNDEALLVNNKYNVPYSKQYILNTQSNPLFVVTGAGASTKIKPAVSETATGVDVLELFKQTMDAIPNTATSESTLATLAVDLQEAVKNRENGLDSVQKALLFQEMCRRQGIPAELYVGWKGTNYYAWAVAFIGTKGYTYDPAGKASQYTMVYKEPEPTNCRGDLYTCPWAKGIRTDLFCIGPICVPGNLLLAFFVLGLIIVFAIFQYKTDIIYKIVGIKTGGSSLFQDQIDGTYEIINENYLPQNPLEQAVWDSLRRRAGSFKSADYVIDTGFSDVLVKSTIEKLEEIGVIKRKY